MAIFEIPEKVCPHCGGTRWAVEPGKTGFVRYRCPVLAQERRKRWKDKNPDLVKMHQQAHHEKRMAAQYFKKRREKLKNQTIINQQLNSNKMAKNSFFYNTQDIKDLKELIRTGESIRSIAIRECARFNTTPQALAIKMYKLAKSTTKIRSFEGTRTRKTKAEMMLARTAQPVEQPTKGIDVPTGTTFEGTPKRVTIHADHFRIYF